MTARIDASDLPAETAKKLGVDQAARKRARPSRAEATDGGNLPLRCAACGQQLGTPGQAERHVRTQHGGGRIEVVLDQEGGQQ